jgi:hypothetical protein
VTPRRADVVVDDHLLLRLLIDDEPPALRPGGARVFTTGLWYHRLCRALASTTVSGAMSRQLGNVPADIAAGIVSAVTELPDTIGIVSLRTLAWPMASLIADGARVNLLTLEALAAALHLDAEICLAAADTNPPLVAAAAARGISVRVV